MTADSRDPPGHSRQGELDVHERPAMARSAFYLLAVGGTISLAALYFPGNLGRDVSASLALAVALYALAATVLIGFTRLPDWCFHLLALAGTAAITAALYHGGEDANVLAFFYFWVILYAGYFFPVWQASLQILLVLAAYSGLAVAGRPSALSPLTWLVTSGTLAVGGCLIVLMRRRVASVLGDLLRSNEDVRERARQQQSIALLGQQALGDGELDRVFVEAVACVVEGLRVEHVSLLELVPGAESLRFRVGAGWPEEAVGATVVPAGAGSEAGYTVLTGEPLIVDDLETERRFEVPALLLINGIVSSLTVAVPGDSRPFGTLGAYSTSQRRFTSDDAAFLHAVANIVGSAVNRSRADRLQEAQRAVLELIAQGAALEETLTSLVQLVEDLVPAATCRVVLEADLLGRPATSADFGLASLPDEPATDLGPSRVCSTPIRAHGEAQVGRLFIELHEPREPGPTELAMGELAARMATIAVERHIDERSLRAREAEARATSERLEALIDASPAAIVELDDEGRVKLWNAAAEQMFGWSSDEAVSAPLPIVPDASRETHDRLVLRAYDRGAADGELTFVTKDGATLKAAVSLAPLGGPSDPSGLMAVLLDMSERKLLEEELRQAQKLEAIGQLAGGIAHDFNNILLAIQSQVWLLLEDLDEGEREKRKLAEGIGEAAERAAALTRQLLAFSRRQALQPKVLDLNSVVAGMEEMLRRLIGEDVELVIELRPALGSVRADPTQLEQVLVNLAVNARDAMPGGGTLRIETADPSSNGAKAAEVVLRVSDTGVGIAPDDQARIFEPFFTTKEIGKGTGLGLATVHGIVTQSDGRIEVSSQPGAGTTFSIYLPRVAAVEEPEQSEPSVEAPGRGSETILLVEDDDMVRAPMARILESKGYRVLTASNGPEAIATLADEPIDLLVTDVIMPKMGGAELADHLRVSQPELRVLYISGYLAQSLDTVERLRGEAHAATGFLRKPFSPEALATEVRALLGAAEQTAPVPSPSL